MKVSPRRRVSVMHLVRQVSIFWFTAFVVLTHSNPSSRTPRMLLLKVFGLGPSARPKRRIADVRFVFATLRLQLRYSSSAATMTKVSFVLYLHSEARFPVLWSIKACSVSHIFLWHLSGSCIMVFPSSPACLFFSWNSFRFKLPGGFRDLFYDDGVRADFDVFADFWELWDLWGYWSVQYGLGVFLPSQCSFSLSPKVTIPSLVFTGIIMFAYASVPSHPLGCFVAHGHIAVHCSLFCLRPGLRFRSIVFCHDRDTDWPLPLLILNCTNPKRRQTVHEIPK